MKRVLLLAIVLIILLTTSSPVFAENENNDIGIVAVNIWGNLYSRNTITLLYDGYNAFIRINDVAELTGSLITQNDDKGIILEKGYIRIEFLVNKNPMIYLNEIPFTFNVNFIKKDEFMYVPIDDILSKLGAELFVDPNLDIPIKVYMPDTLDNVLIDYINCDYGYHFSWSETELTEKDLKKKIINAAIVSLIFEYDYSIFGCLVTNYNKERSKDALIQILQNDGVENLDFGNITGYDFVKNDIETIYTINDWISFFNEVEGDENIEIITDLFGKTEDFKDAIFNLNDAIFTVKQYSNISNIHHKLLEKTLLTVSKKSDPYKQDENVYTAAKEVQKEVNESYNKNYATSQQFLKSELKTLLSEAGKSGAENIPFFKCLSVAWSGAKLITKLLPGTNNTIEQKTLLDRTDVCRSIQVHAYILFSEKYDEARMYRYLNVDRNEEARLALVLKLKSTLSARENLLNSGYVNTQYALELKQEIVDLSRLLNRAMNCRARITYSNDEMKYNDYSWIESYETSLGEFQTDVSAPSQDAILIYNAQELHDKVQSNPTGSFVLACDIDLSSYNDGIWIPLCGDGWGKEFSGTLDGQGHVIKNLYIPESSYTQNAGLFERVSNGTIKNLGVESTEIVGQKYAGAISAFGGGTVYNCYVKCTKISAGKYAGGIFAGADVVEIAYVFIEANIETNVEALKSRFGSGSYGASGGLVSYVTDGNLNASNIVINGNISSKNNGEAEYGNISAGGIIGIATNTTLINISNVSVSGRITAQTTYGIKKTASDGQLLYGGATSYAGGIVGNEDHHYGSDNYTYNNEILFNNCMISADIVSDSKFAAHSGGFMGVTSGLNEKGDVITITNSSYYGSVIATATGGGSSWAGGVFGSCYANSLIKNTVINATVTAKDGGYYANAGKISSQEDDWIKIRLKSVTNNAKVTATNDTGKIFIDGQEK